MSTAMDCKFMTVDRKTFFRMLFDMPDGYSLMYWAHQNKIFNGDISAKKLFRRLMLLIHPDKNPEHSSIVKLGLLTQRLNEEWRVRKDQNNMDLSVDVLAVYEQKTQEHCSPTPSNSSSGMSSFYSKPYVQRSYYSYTREWAAEDRANKIDKDRKAMVGQPLSEDHLNNNEGAVFICEPRNVCFSLWGPVRVSADSVPKDVIPIDGVYRIRGYVGQTRLMIVRVEGTIPWR